MTREEEYISIQLSPFYIRCDEDYHGHVYVRGQEELVEVTKELTDEQKNVLIEDLIYAISELVKERDKALEQTDAIEKIRAEIKQLGFDIEFVYRNRSSDVAEIKHRIFREDVLEIIDKYRKEEQ